MGWRQGGKSRAGANGLGRVGRWSSGGRPGDRGSGGGARRVAPGRGVKARQQTQQARRADAVPADQDAKGRFQRDAERTKQGLSRRKLTGELM